jgi:hypothetical protein
MPLSHSSSLARAEILGQRRDRHQQQQSREQRDVRLDGLVVDAERARQRRVVDRAARAPRQRAQQPLQDRRLQPQLSDARQVVLDQRTHVVAEVALAPLGVHHARQREATRQHQIGAGGPPARSRADQRRRAVEQQVDHRAALAEQL